MAHRKAFTLIEMVVVTALVMIIAALVSVFLTRSLASYRISRQSVLLEENAAGAMRTFERGARAAIEIQSADPSEFSFLRYTDLTSEAPVKVRYFVDGGSFKVGITEPSGSFPIITYPTENESIDLIIDNVTNTTTLFNYFDGANDELSGSFNIASVRMVSLTISLDKNGDLPPAPITQVTKISLRNMKNNL